MLEKSSAQNIAACENQGKQHELSGHWNQLKHHFWKKKRKQGMTQKRQNNWLQYKFYQRSSHPTKSDMSLKKESNAVRCHSHIEFLTVCVKMTLSCRPNHPVALMSKC